MRAQVVQKEESEEMPATVFSVLDASFHPNNLVF